MEKIKLRNDLLVPSLGFGTWKLEGEDAYKSVLNALKIGYRHIDTAAIYGNEVEVGKAIKDSGIDRKDLFVTTKLWNTEQGYESAKNAFEESLNKLGLDYVDLYLIHWPQTRQSELESWKAMEEFYESGKAKAIGVSNFNFHHLDNLIKNCKIKPMVNQVECNISIQNVKLQKYCEENGIILEAYAPLMSSNINELLNNDKLNQIAKEHNASATQIAIKWLITRNIITIPRSSKKENIENNFNIFDIELTEENMKEIRRMNTGRKSFPDPDNIDF